MMTIDKDQIKAHGARRINYILDNLGVKYTRHGELIQGCCPAEGHAGDGNNPTAFSWRLDYEHWVCWTHHCEDQYGGDIIGLIRSVLDISFQEASDWLVQCLTKRGIDLNEKVQSRSTGNAGTVHLHKPLDEQRIQFLKPENPPKFLLDRGFDEHILQSYQVGVWKRLGTFMHNRIVVPVRDHDGRLVGFTGRTLLSKERMEELGESKWIHGRYFDRFAGDFKTGSVLFNLNYAKQFLTSRSIVIVEGPLDGFVFEMAGIPNWAATLGTSFQPQHRSILIENGINEIITAYDPDEAGDIAHERVKSIVGDLITVRRLEGLESDPGDYSKNPDKLRALFDGKRD